jgi:hypothetical protein
MGSNWDSWTYWGPYLAERAWGTVREDYSPGGDAWRSFPHDHARSRVYRWSEDGLAGICDRNQFLCLAFAFWNGRDAVLKERIFGLGGPEGNHGEDAKEYWFFLDSTPSHSWMRWRYLYPQAEFPYASLVAENARRTRSDPEFELLDTGVFDDDRYWEITVDIAKEAADDLVIRLVARNAGPEPATLQVLPTLWFRNTWSWEAMAARPGLRADNGSLVADHPMLGRMVLTGQDPPLDVLVCDNESNSLRLWGVGGQPFPKDGIADHVLTGAPTVNPAGEGTKGALRYSLTVPPKGTARVLLRLSPAGRRPGNDAATLLVRRAREADEFYAELAPGLSPEEALVVRQAYAGLLWSKQYYHYDVERWLDGDPTQPPPPVDRRGGRNSGWRHLNNADVISMPDTWEYPWYASWDLAFQCVALARVDPQLAKDQLILLCREWFMHPNGQLPAYEWSFGDVNPPVHGWAALRVFEIDGRRDRLFLERIFHKLLLNFTWWVNRKDVGGDNVFEGGFLGLDNIGPLNRSAVPMEDRLGQSDATAWMGRYALDLLEMAIVLAREDDAYEDLATKFVEHFCYIARAINNQGLWDETDGFYYDVLSMAGSPPVPLRARSMVGILPLCAGLTLGVDTLARLPRFARRLQWFLDHKPEHAEPVSHGAAYQPGEGRLLAIVDPTRLRRVLTKLFDEGEFLSPFGLRSLSRYHLDHPFRLEVAGVEGSVDYEPGESTVALYGGNSNWRGPIWMPVNFLVIEALRRYHLYFGDKFLIEYPTGSGNQVNLARAADDLTTRLASLFLDDPNGRRPLFGEYQRFQLDPAWHDLLLFPEYFHAETGAGLGATHQTGWTALIAELMISRRV